MRNILYWILTILITLTAVIYQWMTGPTNPKRVKFELSGKEYTTKLPRSLETKGNMEVVISSSADNMMVTLFYRRYPGNDTIQSITATKKGDTYSILLPAQPPAGKIAYFVEINDGTDSATLGLEKNIIMRFKNPVPAWVLIPHIFLMFIAMLLSTYVGIIAFTKSGKVNKYAILVIITLGIGGLILGPMVQKFAFDAFWTGWPFGGDLTDNKTLVAFALWLIAWLKNRQKGKRWWYILAAAIMLLVYSIPHSTAGSEYNQEKGKVVTGFSINTCEHRVY